MEILFVSDYVCPYCLVAKEALKQALERTGIQARITWQPLELTPVSAPQVDTYHDEVRRAKYQILAEPCKALGLDMKLPPAVVPRPRTHLAFQGWYYACQNGMGEAYNDRLYRAYFSEELDIGDPGVLRGIAEELGMDPSRFSAALENGTYSPTLDEAVAYSRKVLQVKGVPAIYIDGNPVTLHDYSLGEMIGLLVDGQSAAAGGFSCGPDGC